MSIFVWDELDEQQRRRALQRPFNIPASRLRTDVAEIIAAVRAGGDGALLELTKRFDGVAIAAVVVSQAEVETAIERVEVTLRAAIDEARARIETFHRALIPQPVAMDTAEGVHCERVYRPIPNVGLYVPAGSAPLPSTVLMLGVPAVLAGCRQVVLCCPPNAQGEVDPAVLYAAHRLGIRQIYRVGGAQAIAAMAYGTGSIGKCDKIFGPGNTWVTEAKQQVAADVDGAVIDMPAGPSEVLVVADGEANAEFVAADLLSQAEHGPDSQVVLVATSAAFIERVQMAMERQLATLSRAEIARQALRHARFIIAADSARAIEVSNRYAPEHLILHVASPRAALVHVEAAGSVFLGPWAPESVGDYCSGTNHVLPTFGYARVLGGIGVESFMTAMTVQQLTPAGLCAIGPAAEILAMAEGLTAHAFAVRVRREAIARQNQSESIP